MLKIMLSASAGVLLALGLNTTVWAQTRVFVAAQGSDSNPCTFAAPCRTFQHAHDVVAAGGEIDVLDPAGYGAVVITKSISIQGHGFSGISVASGGVAIRVNAGDTDVVGLYGLLIEGGGIGAIGISFLSGQSLVIENCVVRNLTSSGIALGPSTRSTIAVSSTVVSDNGGHGIQLQLSTGNVSAVFSRVEVYRNALKGIGVFGNGLQVYATAVDSVAAYNQSGFYASEGAALRVVRCATLGNQFGQGVLSDTGGAVHVTQSNLDQDKWSAGAGGSLLSYGDNYTNGASGPTGTLPKM